MHALLQAQLPCNENPLGTAHKSVAEAHQHCDGIAQALVGDELCLHSSHTHMIDNRQG